VCIAVGCEQQSASKLAASMLDAMHAHVAWYSSKPNTRYNPPAYLPVHY
jgi:hypothetical protein